MEYERILHEIKTTSLEGARSKEVRGNNGKQEIEGMEISNMIGDLINTQIKELIRKRENHILQRLAELGHTFHNEVEKHEFAEKRLSIHTYTDKPKWREMYLDKTHLIDAWWETIDYDGDTIIAGKNPNTMKWHYQ